MCGRYTGLTTDEVMGICEMLQGLSLQIAHDRLDGYASNSYEVFPTDCVPVMIKRGDGVVFEYTRWGFNKWNSPGVIINARVETLRSKSFFSKHLENGRCVVPAGEFFEWERLPGGKKKYYAKDREGNLLFMAGLYRDVIDHTQPEGYVREFVIITKQSTGEIARIHDRMPVILRADQIEAWLTGVLTPEEIVKMEYDIMISPFDGE